MSKPLPDSRNAIPPCPACGGTHRVDAGFTVEKHFPLFHCPRCGLGALDIKDEADKPFDKYWTEVNQRIYAESGVKTEMVAKYEGYYHKAEAEVSDRRFLDVGSGAGMWIGAAARLGFEATGIEPSARAVALSRRQYDLPVIQGLLQADDALPRDYGMLALWDVI